MKLQKELHKLIEAGVISNDTADRIRDYYAQRSNSSPQRLFIAFGILGAVLIGLGIILIIAHNWDELSRMAKTTLSFLPLVVGQLACLYVLFKKNNSTSWREGASAFLFFAVGASISLVSQVYHIQGDLGSYLLTWMLLCAPLIYIMRSSIVSLLYIGGVTWYGCEVGYWTRPASEGLIFWGMLALAVPFYIYLWKKKPDSNFTIFHHWFVPLSLVITLGVVANDVEELMFVAYMSLLGLFIIIGNSHHFRHKHPMKNGYKIIGRIGSIGMLLFASFSWMWREIILTQMDAYVWVTSSEMVSILLIAVPALTVLTYRIMRKGILETSLESWTFLLFIVTYIIGHWWYDLSAVVINIWVFAIGIMTIRDGSIKNHLGILNYGLLIIAALVACRFFDEDISFVIRGLMFIAVGAGFFVANYRMLRKRKAAHASQSPKGDGLVSNTKI